MINVGVNHSTRNLISEGKLDATSIPFGASWTRNLRRNERKLHKNRIVMKTCHKFTWMRQLITFNLSLLVHKSRCLSISSRKKHLRLSRHDFRFFFGGRKSVTDFSPRTMHELTIVDWTFQVWRMICELILRFCLTRKKSKRACNVFS